MQSRSEAAQDAQEDRGGSTQNAGEEFGEGDAWTSLVFTLGLDFILTPNLLTPHLYSLRLRDVKVIRGLILASW